MLKAIIFDCFGVLTASDGWLPFRDHYLSNDADLLGQGNSLNKQADAGLITYDDFIKGVAKLAGVPEEQARITIDDNVTNDALFRYIARLKPRYKIGMLSNAAANWLDELFTPAQVALFDATMLSYESGFIKPQPRAYEIIAERLGVTTRECLFIDDQED